MFRKQTPCNLQFKLHINKYIASTTPKKIFCIQNILDKLENTFF